MPVHLSAEARRLFGALGSSAGARILALAVGFLSSVVLARSLGPTELGSYGFALASISMLAIPVQLGLPTLVLRETSSAFAQSNYTRMRVLWRWADRVIAFSSCLVMVITGVFIHASWTGTQAQWAVVIGFPLIPLLALVRTRAVALAGLGHVVWGTLPDEVFRPAFLAALVGLGFLWVPPSAPLAMGFHLLAGCAALFISYNGLRALGPNPQDKKDKQSLGGIYTEWFRALIPLSLIAGMQVIQQNTDIVMLGLLHTHHEVGYYRVAMGVSAVALVGITAIRMVIAPRYSALYAKGDTLGLQKLASQAAVISLSTTLCTLLVIGNWGIYIIKLMYGVEFEPSYIPLLLLVSGQCVFAFFGPIGALVYMLKLESVALRVLASSACVNIVLNALLIPMWGGRGAAFASAVATGASSIAFWRIVYRRRAIDASPLWYVQKFFERSNPL